MATPPSKVDTQNLTAAINKLTETLGQNDSTMKDLAKQEKQVSDSMKRVKDFGEDFADNLMQQDIALGLAVKGLAGIGKGIGKLAGFGKKGGEPGAGKPKPDLEVGTERMGADGYIYVFKGKQWVLKPGQKDKSGKKLGNRIAPKNIAAGLFGRGGKPTTGPSVSPTSPAGMTTTPDTAAAGSGMGSMLAPDYSTSAKAGFGIAAVGAGIAGFISALALGGAAVNALGGASGVKDMLSAVGEGLSTFNTQSLVGFGALLAVGGIFGAVAGPSGAVTQGVGAGIGMTMIGLGIGGFFTGLAAGAAAVDAIGGSSGIKDMLTALGEGLGSFNTQSLVAFGAMLGTGALFGAVPGLGAAAAGTAALGMTAIGFGIGGFFTGLASGGKAVKELGGGSVIKDMIVGLGDGLASFNNVNGGNLMKAGKGVEALAIGIAGLAVEGVIGKIVDFFTGGSDEDSTLTKVAKSLIVFEEVDGENLKNIGDGISGLASGLLTLASIPKIDTKNLSQTAATLGAMNGVSVPSAPGGTPPGQTQNATYTPLSPTGASVNVGGAPNKDGGVTADKTQLMQYFMSQGYSKNEAAAIVGNFMAESGLNTAAKGDKNMAGGASVGLAQWREGRLENLKKFAAERDMDVNDPMTQAQFANFELQGDENRALKKLREASAAGASPEQLADIFAKFYERPKRNEQGQVYGYEERTNYAAQLAKADIPAIGDNLNMASTDVENAAAAPATIVVNAPQISGGQQPKQSSPTPPAIAPGRPSYASVAGPSYRGFQVSDIRTV